MCAMRLGVAVWLTDTGVGITDLATRVEEAGLESLFLTAHTHVPVSRRDLVQGDRPGEDARLLDQFTALGAAAACTSRLRLGTASALSRSTTRSHSRSRSRRSTTSRTGASCSASAPAGSSRSFETTGSTRSHGGR
jgi:luciferase-like monooxygenase